MTSVPPQPDGTDPRRDILDHIIRLAQTEPVEAGVLLVQATTAPDPSDPLRLPWSNAAAVKAATKLLNLTPLQAARVRNLTVED